MVRSHRRPFLEAASFLAGLVLSAGPLVAQTQTEDQFIASVNAAIRTATAKLPASRSSIIFGGQLVWAHGSAVDNFAAAPASSVQNYVHVLLGYVDGLKAAGAQRIEFNPGFTSLSNPNQTAIYDAVVKHIRQLGLRLAINAEVNPGDVGKNPTFEQFQSAALQGLQQLAQRYQPDNLVIVHEPTTMNARLNLTTTVQQWHDFVMAAGPLIKAVSPHTRIGAGPITAPLHRP